MLSVCLPIVTPTLSSFCLSCLNSITSICQYLLLMMFMFMAVVPVPVMVSMLVMAFRCPHLVLVAHHHNHPQSLVSHSILCCCRGRRCHVLPLSAAVRQVEGSVVQKVLAVFDFTERKHKARPRREVLLAEHRRGGMTLTQGKAEGVSWGNLQPRVLSYMGSFGARLRMH